MNRLYMHVMAAVILLVNAAPVSATPIINNTGIASPTQTITFSELSFATGTPITNQFSSFGATFSPSLFYNVQPAFFPTPSLANFDLGANINNPVTITFSHPVTSAAFAMQTNAGTSTFTALLNGVPVESFTAPTTLSFLPDLSHASDYFGFQGITFNQITVTSGTTFFQIDNLQIGASAVPEPATVAVFVMMAITALGIRRVRNATA